MCTILFMSDPKFGMTLLLSLEKYFGARRESHLKSGDFVRRAPRLSRLWQPPRGCEVPSKEGGCVERDSAKETPVRSQQRERLAPSATAGGAPSQQSRSNSAGGSCEQRPSQRVFSLLTLFFFVSPSLCSRASLCLTSFRLSELRKKPRVIRRVLFLYSPVTLVVLL